MEQGSGEKRSGTKGLDEGTGRGGREGQLERDCSQILMALKWGRGRLHFRNWVNRNRALEGWAQGSVGEHLPGVWEVLGSVSDFSLPSHWKKAPGFLV